jgi:hypothetical protein
MTDYVLNKKLEPASNEMVWAFDLGHPLRLERGEDRGEVSNPVNQKTEVNTITQFLQKASLLIPAEFAETKTAAGRRRMWRRPHEGNRIRKMRMTVGERFILNCHKMHMTYDAKPAA